MFNRAISGTYSPGSTYKMLMGIAGLESGGIYVDEYYTDPGEYPYAYKPKCWIYTAHQITHGSKRNSQRKIKKTQIPHAYLLLTLLSLSQRKSKKR